MTLLRCVRPARPLRSSRPTVLAGWFAIAASALPGPGHAQQPESGAPRPAWRELATDDGSRFLLVPTGGAPIVHWVSLTPAGPGEDPAGIDGLSFAVARAALAGTSARGTARPRAERDALDALDRIEQEVDAKTAAGEVDEELLATLEKARAAAAALFDATAWETAVRAAPALGSELHLEPDGVALRITCTVSAVPRIAQLLVERREGDRLRGVRSALRAVRTEAPRVAETDMHRELVALCGLPTGSRGSRAPLPHSRALEVYRRTHHPSRTVHVLTGGFDPDTLVGVLDEAFATTSIPSPVLAAPPPHSRAERRAVFPTRGPETVALAMPLPEGASVAAARALTAWLADGAQSPLATALAARGRAESAARAIFPFPHRSGGLIMVEVEVPAARAAGTAPLVDDVLAALDSILAQPPDRPALTAALRTMNAQRILAFAGARALSLRLALDWGLSGLEPATMLAPPRPPSPDEVADLARRLRRQSGRAIVIAEVAR